MIKKKIKIVCVIIFLLLLGLFGWRVIYASGPVYQEPCRVHLSCYMKLGVNRMREGYQTSCHPGGFCTITNPDGIAPVFGE